MARLRVELGLPLHARIGIHCGPVVSGIVGSQRPRFCEWDARNLVDNAISQAPALNSTGVLGPALLEAEAVEAAGSPDGVSCTGAAQRVYLSSTFMFVERAPLAGNATIAQALHTRKAQTPSPAHDKPSACIDTDGAGRGSQAVGTAGHIVHGSRGIGGVFDVAPPLSPSPLLRHSLAE